MAIGQADEMSEAHQSLPYIHRGNNSLWSKNPGQPLVARDTRTKRSQQTWGGDEPNSGGSIHRRLRIIEKVKERMRRRDRELGREAREWTEDKGESTAQVSKLFSFLFS